MPFLKHKSLKLKIRVFLASHSVAMVTYCVTKIIPTCSPVIGQSFDTMIVAFNTSGVVKRQSSRVTSHDLAIAVRLLLQCTISSIVKVVISIFRRGDVDVLLNNETKSFSEIRRVASLKNILAFTDSGAYEVKVYDPVDKVVL